MGKAREVYSSMFCSSKRKMSKRLQNLRGRKRFSSTVGVQQWKFHKITTNFVIYFF